MSKIKAIELIPLVAPLSGRPYGMAGGLINARQANILRVQTEDGTEGLGEAWGPAAAVRACLDILPLTWSAAKYTISNM